MRAIKAVVLILAVLIVVALGAVVWTIVDLKGPTDNGPLAARIDAVSLGLPHACAIADIDLDGDRLAVRTDGPPAADCRRVYLVDVVRGQVIGTVAP